MLELLRGGWRSLITGVAHRFPASTVGRDLVAQWFFAALIAISAAQNGQLNEKLPLPDTCGITMWFTAVLISRLIGSIYH